MTRGCRSGAEPGPLGVASRNEGVDRGECLRAVAVGLLEQFVARAVDLDEAGGIITAWDGGPAEMGGEIIAAGSHKVYDEAMALLNA